MLKVISIFARTITASITKQHDTLCIASEARPQIYIVAIDLYVVEGIDHIILVNPEMLQLLVTPVRKC